jgi:hypothetical protein
VGYKEAARCLPGDLDELTFKRFDKEFAIENEAIAIHLACHDGLGSFRFTKVHGLINVLRPGGADEFRHVELQHQVRSHPGDIGVPWAGEHW